MRKTFISTLESLAEKDERILLFAGDVGYGVLETFMKKFPDRYFNLGICEQNIVSVATGAALKGKIPFVYSINSFLVFRSLEQIRMLSHMNLHAVLVGVGLYDEYTNNGISHYSFGDKEILNEMPNLKVITPENKEEVIKKLIKAYNEPAPYYFRLSRFGELKKR